MTANTSDEKIGGASESAPQTRVFVSRKHGFKVVRLNNDAYVLIEKGGMGAKHSDPREIVDVIEVVHGKRLARRLAKRLT